MAVKKSELYSTLWASCDELRGGMEPSQYKDYVLLLLFVRYVSDKAKFDTNISIPSGSSFEDFVTFKNKTDIGEKMNTAVRALAKANTLDGVFDNTDFNDEGKLGKGKDLVETLTKLIGIFENPNLNFANNRADGDDILGDAYEYLMMKFSIESGKSKGQFYTPAEVSRIMAKVVGVENASSNKETIYDPTCGSGSLLLKAVELANTAKNVNLTVYGQEFVTETSALARMNMWLHGASTAEIKNGNTMASPEFLDKEGNLRTFNYCVANPPFSDKKWRNNLGKPSDDIYKRFIYGTPPDKNGDYAFLQHLVASIKEDGAGAIILPHGVLFRGNAEEKIRTNLINAGIIKAVIGLPANLFYGTAIPACIIVLDKKNRSVKRDIFMVEASKGFIKDGNKNRLREQDIHAIIDAFDHLSNHDKFSRLVPYAEIEKNGFNLNIPRYIDSSLPVDIQDIQAHISGGIPEVDIDQLDKYWKAFPTLRKSLLKKGLHNGYLDFLVETANINKFIHSNPDVAIFKANVMKEFEVWKETAKRALNDINKETRPKIFVKDISDKLLECFKTTNLVDEYEIYQGFMQYWDSTMKDDFYLIVENGWIESANPHKIGAKSKESIDFQINKDKFHSETLPSSIIVKAFLADEADALAKAEADLEVVSGEIVEFYEGNSGDEDLISEYFTAKGRVIKKDLTALLKDVNLDKEVREILKQYQVLIDEEDALKEVKKNLDEALTAKIINAYKNLDDTIVKTLIIDHKWLDAITNIVQGQLDRLIQTFTMRLIELEDRYKSPLPAIERSREELSKRVNKHLETMGIC
ncbi:type I restriction enzyme M protein [Candidatus Planktophila dulcis]|uniref:site-specific DNA-methyltransferase (adenine-specific) n=1 Tax=Candidatus Planktophila dulcis TaxID=1884914 RepID=A0AAC9YUU4_9ACTN|nr:type I restriction-modification system subunit M [Candidatus Planktophila dulcis]ASY11819.1 type I restriction enzyme M protein [Candidatus Planktophila dulcis]